MGTESSLKSRDTMNRIRFFFTTLLLSLILISIAIPGTATQPVLSRFPVPQEVVSAQAAVYRLKIGGRSFCTGFAFNAGNQKLLMSAGHCAGALKYGLPIVAYNQVSGKSSTLKLVTAVNNWPTTDYSIWNLGGDPDFALQVVSKVPAIGEDIFSVVGPQELTPFIVTGIYSGQVWDVDDPTSEISGIHLITILGGTNGASGSPVMDSRGRVWGILIGGDHKIPGAVFVVLVPRV
jgi:hypothetical protein